MIKKGNIFRYKIGSKKGWRVVKAEDGIVHFERANKTPEEIQALIPNDRPNFLRKVKVFFVLEKMEMVTSPVNNL